MTERLLHALISTGIFILVVPIAGLIIGWITEGITILLSRGIGIKAALFVMNYVTFIGTIHHELSHALYALLTGAKVTKVEVFKPQGNRLGKVEYIPRGNFFTKSLQHTFSAVAPTVQGFITELLLFKLFMYLNGPLWQKIVLGYVMFSIFIHMTLSGADVKAALKGLPIVFILIFAVCAIFGIDLWGTFAGMITGG